MRGVASVKQSLFTDSGIPEGCWNDGRAILQRVG